MNDELFDTEEKREQAITDFTSLIDHPGWKLYVKILDANIQVLKDQLENGIEDETKADVDRIRDKLKICRENRNTPATILAKLQPEESEPVNDDPYYQTVEQVDNDEKES